MINQQPCAFLLSSKQSNLRRIRPVHMNTLLPMHIPTTGLTGRRDQAIGDSGGLHGPLELYHSEGEVPRLERRTQKLPSAVQSFHLSLHVCGALCTEVHPAYSCRSLCAMADVPSAFHPSATSTGTPLSSAFRIPDRRLSLVRQLQRIRHRFLSSPWSGLSVFYPCLGSTMHSFSLISCARLSLRDFPYSRISI